MSIIIGIDPSIDNCGLAIFQEKEGKKMLILLGCNAFECCQHILTLAPNLSGVFLEDVNADSPVFPSKKAANFAANMMTAQNVGKNKGAQLIIEQALSRVSCPIVKIAPSSRNRVREDRKDVGAWLQALTMPTKTTAEQFRYLAQQWGVEIASTGNKDSRDAATLLQRIFVK